MSLDRIERYAYLIILGWSVLLIDFILWKSIGPIVLDHYPQLSVFFLNSLFMVISFALPITIHSVKHALLKGEFCSINKILISFVITFPVLIILSYLYGLIAKFYGGSSVNPLINSGTTVFIFFVILGPTLEEILYRSIILKSLFEMTSTTKAIFIVAVVNTISHLATSRFIWFLLFVFLSEVILSISYLKGKLGASVLNHCLLNLIAFRIYM